jgi:5-methyltetrahydrofolate--homocysteine methyltransferase
MKTVVSGKSKTIEIGPDVPIVMIGERINPSGKKRLATALKEGDLDVVREEARTQVEAGAEIIDVNVVTSGVNEVEVLPLAVKAVLDEVDVPICIDINDIRALEAALAAYPGKAIVNSVTGEEKSLSEVLPIVKSHGAAVIGLTMDDSGIPKDADTRVAIAGKIVERAAQEGIPSEYVIIDCLALTLGADSNSALVTLNAIAEVKSQLGVNQTLGASNVSYGLPERELINQMFLAAAIAAGITCPTVDPLKMRQPLLALDLILGRDRFAQRFLKDYREREGRT